MDGGSAKHKRSVRMRFCQVLLRTQTCNSVDLEDEDEEGKY